MAPLNGGAGGGARAGWIEGAALAMVVLLLLGLGGDVVRASYHGFLHVEVGQAVLEHGLTPENPYHAGAPLRYYTLYPALGVLVGKLGFGPLWGFALLNVLAALLFGPALDALGRAFGLTASARRWAFVAAVFGFNALGWIGLVVASGDLPDGAAPVMRLAPMTFAGTPLGWDQRLQAFLPKFLNVSSFALALPFSLWALAGAIRPAAARPARTGLAAGAALAINPLVGAFGGLLMAVWLAPELARGGWRRRLVWPLAGTLAVLVALPFLLPAFQPAAEGGPEVQVQLGGRPLADWFGPLVLLLAAAAAGWRELERALRWRWAVAALAAGLLLGWAELPWGNEYKMARLGALFWALPAGAGLAALGRRRAWLPWAFLALALPTTALVPGAYLSWAEQSPPLPLAAEGGELRFRPGYAQAIPEAVLAAEAAADPRAALVADPVGLAGQLGGGRVQGHPLAPLLRHPLVVDQLQVHNEGQPDLEFRTRCAAALYAPRSGLDAPALLAELRSRFPGRPLLVLLRDADPGGPAVAAAPGATELVAEGGFSLWRLPPPG